MQLILGSQSPRRKEILSYFKLKFTQVVSHFDETSILFKQDPIAYVKAITAGKALALKDNFPKAAILTADTIVYFKNQVYGKPNSFQEALTYLKTLQGQTHQVITAVSLHYQSQAFSAVEITDVTMQALSDIQISSYLKTIDYQDKAGSYAIQKTGSLLIKKIAGCYYNVMGLPIQKVEQLLNAIHLSLWDAL